MKICMLLFAFVCFITNAHSADVPKDWVLHQWHVSDGGSYFFGYQKGDEYVRVYSKLGGVDFKSIFVNGNQILEEGDVQYGGLTYRHFRTSKNGRVANSFGTTDGGVSYYGYSNTSQSAENIKLFMSRTIAVPVSLTNPEFQGKKYYVGFGDTLSGFMGNEVKYDIKHTHDIFTERVGGDYTGVQILASGPGKIKDEWNKIQGAMTWNDMYVQYSSGHGSQSGLAIGLSYNQIRDNALAMPAKEVVIFIMACHSGGLVESFNEKKDTWKDWGSYGRSLFVLASSKRSETSSTGPGKDPEEPEGPSGSAGSAFGHALWKALIGHADGYLDGIKDGFLELEEIREYTISKTKSVGGHTPVHTGSYVNQTIMNRVPSKEWVQEKGAENLSEDQLHQAIQNLSEELYAQ